MSSENRKADIAAEVDSASAQYSAKHSAADGAKAGRKVPDIRDGKLYNSSLARLSPMFIAGYIASVFLILQGRKNLLIYPAVAEDPSRYFMGFAPVVLAVFIFLGLSIIICKNFGRRIGITKTFFLYRTKRGAMEKMPWTSVAINAPLEKDVGFFSVASVTDGKTSIQIEKCFFPEFEEICQNIQSLSKAARNM